jgi:hypothetical protein
VDMIGTKAFSLIFFSLSCFFSDHGFAGECDEWFKEAKIKPGNECLVRCTALTVDMGTFDCPNECSRLCALNHSDDFLFKISDLYPGLSAEERALTVKEPIKMWGAYKLTWRAEKICLRIYKASRTNEESDAFRHFVWAGLLFDKFGAEFTNQVLNAHEQNPRQPQVEKSMDLANNRLGLLVAQQLKSKGGFNEVPILKTFEDNLKQNRIIIIEKVPKNKRGVK